MIFRTKSVPKFLTFVLPPLAFFVVLICVWQAVVVIGDKKPYQLPSPWAVFESSREHASELGAATALTAAAALTGFAMSLIIGTLTAIVFSQWRVVARSCYPYAIFLQTVPIVAIAPIIIRWFGAGFFSVSIVAFIISLFPIITGVTLGLVNIDTPLLELFELHNATRLQTLMKLRLPSAVPNLVTAAKTSAGLSVVGAIVGETYAGFTGESKGLGYYIWMANDQMKMDYLFASVICSALLGLAVFISVSVMGATILSRWYTTTSRQTLTDARDWK